MTDKATTHFVIKYKEPQDSGSKILVKIDPDKHPDENIKPGEDAYFRVYANCDYEMILSDYKSSVSEEDSSVYEEIEERISFIQSKHQELSHPYYTNFSYEQIGSTYNFDNIPTPDSGQTKVSMDLEPDAVVSEYIAVFDVQYKTKYTLYKLTPNEAYNGFAVNVLIKEI